MKRSFFLLAIVLCGCPPERPEIKNRTQDDSAPVVEVNGEGVLLAEFERRLSILPADATQSLQTVDQKRAHLEYVAQFETLVDLAQKEGYETDPRAIFAAKREIVRMTEEGVAVDPKAIEEAVDDAVSRRREPLKRRISVFTADDPNRCEQMKAELGEVADIADRFDAFSEFARTASSHPTAERGGNLGLIYADDHPPFSEIGFDGPLGELKPAPVPKGCALVLATGELPSPPPDRLAIEEEVRETLKKAAIEERRAGSK